MINEVEFKSSFCDLATLMTPGTKKKCIERKKFVMLYNYNANIKER